MSVPVRTTLAAVGLAAAFALAPSDASAGGSVKMLVLKEHGIGTAAQAQPFIDKIMAAAAQQNGWAGASGVYHTTRSGAEAFVQSDKPSYGILSLSAFLAFMGKHNVEPIGQVSSSTSGGQQYFLVSKNQADINACKGKTLATDHGDDPKFINKVVFDGKYALTDFTLVTTTRPIQTLKKVDAGEAECALIDDAQLGQVASAAPGLKTVWTSGKLIPLVVVAFPSADKAEKTKFQGNLGNLCASAGNACKEVGITALTSANAATYDAIIKAYNK